MSSDLHQLLNESEDDVNTAPLAPAAAVRARGESRVRRRMVVLALVAVATVAGTGIGIAQLLDSRHALPPAGPDPSLSAQGVQLTVFLKASVTEEEKRAIEAELRSLRVPGEIRFVSRQEAWERFKEIYKDAPELVGATTPQSLPESFRVTLSTPIDAAAEARLRVLPGVDEVIQRDPNRLTVPTLSPTPMAPPNTIQVFLRLDATLQQKDVIGAALRTFRLVGEARFESRHDAWERFKEVYRDAPELVAATTPEMFPERFVVKLADPADRERVRAQVSKLPGVDSATETWSA